MRKYPTFSEIAHAEKQRDNALKKLEQLRAILAPAIEAARERECRRKNQLDGYECYLLPDIWRTDKALLSAGEILNGKSETT